jgi:sigma-B regulation protein RsbU (phosphoserine phosphatase)
MACTTDSKTPLNQPDILTAVSDSLPPTNSAQACFTGAGPGPPTGTQYEDCVKSLGRLPELNDRLCRAMEQTADSVVMTDKRAVIEYVNPAFERTTGYAASEVLGKTPSILKSGLHQQEFYKRLWSQLLAGESFRGTIINRKKSGELYWSEQTISPVKNEKQEITHFVSVLKDITELRRQQEQEFHLKLAHEVQARFYGVKASLPGFDIAGIAHSADRTGGDYFDFIPQPDGRVDIVIADVSGHGFGSALVMATTRAYLRAYAKSEWDLGSVLSRVNGALVSDLDGSQYVTLLLVRLDPRKRSFEYASAGHVPGYLLQRSGEVRLVMTAVGPPCGLFPDWEFPSSPAVPLHGGETVVLLTDGVTETENRDGVEFGADRVLELIRGHVQSSAHELADAIYNAARTFAGDEPQRDDLTSVICRVSPVP